MYALSSKFNWTPDQIREMANKDVQAYITMLNGENAAARAKKIDDDLKAKNRRGWS